MNNVWRTALMVAVFAAGVPACAPRKTPAVPAPAALRYPEYPAPTVPATLKVAPEIRDQHDLAWRRLQNGDLRAAEREFSAVLQQSPGFFPSETGLGFTLLAGKQYRQASAQFRSATAHSDRYVPAWLGLAEAQLAQGNDAEAIAALERVVAIDPQKESLRARIDLLKFRQVQALIETGRKARIAGRYDEADAVLQSALALSPTSGIIHHELAAVALERGAHDAAETQARKAIQLDESDAGAFAILGAALEAKARYRDAATAYASAARLDPRPEWKAKSDALRAKADEVVVPAEFKAIPTAATVTRAQMAALIGVRLESLVARAPRRAVPIATDVRGHWAEEWILPVTQAGIMDVSPNHMFQPASAIRRIDLARVVAQLLTIATTSRPAELTRWKASRPKFIDLPGTNVYYPAAALAIASGAMTVQDGERFAATRPATGADVLAAITRLEQLAVR